MHVGDSKNIEEDMRGRLLLTFKTPLLFKLVAIVIEPPLVTDVDDPVEAILATFKDESCISKCPLGPD